MKWKPTSAEESSFDALVAKKISEAGVDPKTIPPQCTSIASQRRYFDAGAHGRFAVGTSNTGYVIARLRGADWQTVAFEYESPKSHRIMCRRPIAIFDMNGDGAPEVVLRFSEGEWWGEQVLSLDPKGTYRVVALSPGGSTA